MQAVSLYPDVIYLDSFIPPIEQLHLIHYLSKNIQTRRIPLMVDEAFVQLHPGVLEMAKENTIKLSPLESEEAAMAQALELLPEKTNLFTYSRYDDKNGEEKNQALEGLFLEALNHAM